MIKIEHLSKNYGNFVALSDLCIEIADGELFCFLGPNGAGKTTTLKILTGLLKPSSGTAYLNGYNIQSQSIELRKLIGYIPDMPYIYERLTVMEFCLFIADLYSIPTPIAEKEISKLLELFSLSSYSSTLIKDLSHGMRQRLIYCTTLLHNPSILLIDEPLIGLDPYTIRLIKNLLRDFCRKGNTIFLTTHILALAEDIADRIGVINNGRLLDIGTLNELKQKYNSKNLEDVFIKITSENM